MLALMQPSGCDVSCCHVRWWLSAHLECCQLYVTNSALGIRCLHLVCMYVSVCIYVWTRLCARVFVNHACDGAARLDASASERSAGASITTGSSWRWEDSSLGWTCYPLYHLPPPPAVCTPHPQPPPGPCSGNSSSGPPCFSAGSHQPTA